MICDREPFAFEVHADPMTGVPTIHLAGEPEPLAHVLCVTSSEEGRAHGLRMAEALAGGRRPAAGSPVVEDEASREDRHLAARLLVERVMREVATTCATLVEAGALDDRRFASDLRHHADRIDRALDWLEVPR